VAPLKIVFFGSSDFAVPAMAALKAQPYPWFLPAYSIRLTDFSVYTSLVQTYGFGSPVIIGLSPTAASASAPAYGTSKN
jgi:hypothetical protein